MKFRLWALFILMIVMDRKAPIQLQCESVFVAQISFFRYFISGGRVELLLFLSCRDEIKFDKWMDGLNHSWFLFSFFASNFRRLSKRRHWQELLFFSLFKILSSITSNYKTYLLTSKTHRQENFFCYFKFVWSKATTQSLTEPIAQFYSLSGNSKCDV